MSIDQEIRENKSPTSATSTSTAEDSTTASSLPGRQSPDSPLSTPSQSPSEYATESDDGVSVVSNTDDTNVSHLKVSSTISSLSHCGQQSPDSRSSTPSQNAIESDDTATAASNLSNDEAAVRPKDLQLRHRLTHRRAVSAPPDRLPTYSFSSVRRDLTKKQKLPAIVRALNADPVDIVTIRRHAISNGGLINNALRRKAWPKLLNVNVFNISKKPAQKYLKAHRDYSQVVLDVDRSLRRFPPGMKDDQRAVLQDQLVDVIMRILVKHKDLHYYQGYHDICVTFLLVVGEDVTFALIDKLSTNHLRDFMDKTMARTNHMLNYLYPIIGRASPQLRQHMEKAELGTIFCLPWLITWYGHVLGDVKHVVRLYDFFLACHPLMPIYLAAALVLYREKSVLECDCDMAMIHCLLSKIPPDLPVEHLISNAGDLYVQYPPDELAQEAQLHYKQSSSIANYNKFIKTCLDQRPDSVLKLTTLTPSQDASRQGGVDMQTTLVKYSVWALSAGLSAAALAVISTAMEMEWFS